MPWESLAGFLGSEALLTPHPRETAFSLPEPELRPCFAEQTLGKDVSRGIYECIPAKLTTVIKTYSSRPVVELPLLTILEIFKDSLCSHPNDRIFSLVSMMKERQHVQIDYELQLHELCWRIVRNLQINAGIVVDLEQVHGLLCDQFRCGLPCEPLWDHGHGLISMELLQRTTVSRVLQVKAEDNPGSICSAVCDARKRLSSYDFVNDSFDFVKSWLRSYVRAATRSFNLRETNSIDEEESQSRAHVERGSELLRSLLLSLLDCQSFENPPQTEDYHDTEVDIQWKGGQHADGQTKISSLGNAMVKKLNRSGGWVAVCADGSICVSSCGIKTGDMLCYDPAVPRRLQLLVVRSAGGDSHNTLIGTARMMVNSCGCLDCIQEPSSVDLCDCSSARHLPDAWKANPHPCRTFNTPEPQIRLETTEWRRVSIDQPFGTRHLRNRQIAFMLRYGTSKDDVTMAIDAWRFRRVDDTSAASIYKVCEWALIPDGKGTTSPWTWDDPSPTSTKRLLLLEGRRSSYRQTLGQKLLSKARWSPKLESLLILD